ncbi:MAG: 50S ribosomal protein L35 [Bacillota bacterium]|nr:MAG: 50S ribosomal protein L35 [Bacillota bacterium]
MPKMKTHRGAAKRFDLTKKRKIKRAKAYKSHLLSHKSKKRKRRLRKPAFLTKADYKRVLQLIPYK